MKKTLAALILASVAGSVLAQQTLKPEEMIKTRKAAYSFMAWNMGKIKANLDGSFNQDQVVHAANAVAAVANSGLGALFGPGTDKEVGGEKTRVKPEFFQQQDKAPAKSRGISTKRPMSWPRSRRRATKRQFRRSLARPVLPARRATTVSGTDRQL